MVRRHQRYTMNERIHHIASRLLYVALACVVPVAEADTLLAGYPACSTRQAYSQYIEAATRSDDQAMASLLMGACLITRTDIPVSIVETTWTGQTRVRAFIDNHEVMLWTSVRHIQQQ